MNAQVYGFRVVCLRIHINIEMNSYCGTILGHLGLACNIHSNGHVLVGLGRERRGPHKKEFPATKASAAGAALLPYSKVPVSGKNLSVGTGTQ
jgi:hypothetical protein